MEPKPETLNLQAEIRKFILAGKFPYSSSDKSRYYSAGEVTTALLNWNPMLEGLATPQRVAALLRVSALVNRAIYNNLTSKAQARYLYRVDGYTVNEINAQRRMAQDAAADDISAS